MQFLAVPAMTHLCVYRFGANFVCNGTALAPGAVSRNETEIPG